jgi:hypothetical protein
MIIEKTEAEIKHEPPPFGKPLLCVRLIFFMLIFSKLETILKIN